MRKISLILILFTLVITAMSCSDSKTTWEEYSDWRTKNNAWLYAQLNKTNEDGSKYYTKLTAGWDPQSYVLIKYFNDRNLTKDNYSPLYTSTVDVKYIGRTYDNEAFDSSYLNTSPADSIFRTSLTSVIGGWTIALTNMHIGDSCEVVIPYEQAYGSTGTTGINPYSALKFNIKLVGIPGLVIPVD